MYCRIKWTTNQQGKTYEYLQIVQAVRQGKTVTQKVLMTLGRVDEMKDGQVERLVESLAKFAPNMMAMQPQEDVERRDFPKPLTHGALRNSWCQTPAQAAGRRSHRRAGDTNEIGARDIPSM